MDLRLAPFEPTHASAVVGWVSSPQEAERWASVPEVPDAGVFERWRADVGVRLFVLLADGTPCGYGEVWEDVEEHEAELGRIVVDPGRRGLGVGRTLTKLLAREARRHGFEEIWLRVVPENAPAIACYGAAGFVRACAKEEASFNRGQPRGYVWMRWARPCSPHKR
jgi:ribosomal protein S18 acetylase RimI-like enzyme